MSLCIVLAYFIILIIKYKLCFHNDIKQVYYTTSTGALNVGPGL